MVYGNNIGYGSVKDSIMMKSMFRYNYYSLIFSPFKDFTYQTKNSTSLLYIVSIRTNLLDIYCIEGPLSLAKISDNEQPVDEHTLSTFKNQLKDQTRIMRTQRQELQRHEHLIKGIYNFLHLQTTRPFLHT